MLWFEAMPTGSGYDDDDDDESSNHALHCFNSQELWVPLFELLWALPLQYCRYPTPTSTVQRLAVLNICLVGFAWTLLWYLVGTWAVYHFRCWPLERDVDVAIQTRRSTVRVLPAYKIDTEVLLRVFHMPFLFLKWNLSKHFLEWQAQELNVFQYH